MTTEELRGRMSALEVIALTSLGLNLVNTGDDADLSRARAVLDHLRLMIDGRALAMSEEAGRAARTYGDELLSITLENLHLLRAGR